MFCWLSESSAGPGAVEAADGIVPAVSPGWRWLQAGSRRSAADVAAAQAAGMNPSLLDRLTLNPQRLAAIANDVEHVATLPDPVGKVYDQRTLPSGLRLHKRRVPLGVVGVIYEARPNVTVDVAALCLKAGSAAILRGGKETMRSNAALVATIQRALTTCDLPGELVQAITDPDRALMMGLLKLDRYVDMIIPRGGAGLHHFCREHATVPVITGGIGVCHMFVDETADIEAAIPLIRNAKIQKPSACNALDTLLVHRAIAAHSLPLIGADLVAHGVALHADAEAQRILAAAGIACTAATADDWGQEFLALIAAIRVVDDLDTALDHIAEHSQNHSDAILTRDDHNAARFVQEVDSAAVFVNASTRFNDGGQFGLGAEVAISTQKLHARGPMGLEELTTYKWVAEGEYLARA